MLSSLTLEDYMTNLIIIATTLPTQEDATRIGRGVLEAYLAVCTSSVPQLHSMYYWNGALEESTEVLLLIKAWEEKKDAIYNYITSCHPYDTPLIVSISPSEWGAAYLTWASS
jgi:periplasmic divalent cation tolerance protein